MKRNELSVWPILVAASIAGSLVAAAIPNHAPNPMDKRIKHATETNSDQAYTWVTTQSQTKHNSSDTQRLTATESY